MLHDRIELDSKSEKAPISHLHENVMHGLNTYHTPTQVAESAQQRAIQDKQWQNGKIDFGTAGDLYGKSKNAEHPFTPAEIADAGAVRAVELNGMFTGNESILDGDLNPNRAHGHPETRQDAAVDGLSEPSPSFTNKESQSERRQDILANLAQTGSAGVRQLGLPDCTFEAAVASVASLPQGRIDISNMISLNKDGSYEVTFPGDPQHPIDVTSQDLTNNKIKNSAGWANVLEAANLKLNPQEAAHGGKGIELNRKYLEQLTGHKPYSADLRQWAAADEGPEQQSAQRAGVAEHETQGERLLEIGLREGYAVEAVGVKVGQPLESHHAYSVLGIENGQVLVRNPWGNENIDKINHIKPRVGSTWRGVTNLGGGESSMPYETFVQDLPHVTFDKP